MQDLVPHRTKQFPSISDQLVDVSMATLWNLLGSKQKLRVWQLDAGNVWGYFRLGQLIVSWWFGQRNIVDTSSAIKLFADWKKSRCWQQHKTIRECNTVMFLFKLSLTDVCFWNMTFFRMSECRRPHMLNRRDACFHQNKMSGSKILIQSQLPSNQDANLAKNINSDSVSLLS